MKLLCLAAALAFMPVVTFAQSETPCPAQAPLPDYAAGFDTPASFNGDTVMITTGLAVKLKLAPIETVTGLADQQPKSGTFAGRATMVVTSAGTYGVAASAGAWLDVIKDGKALTSTDHARVDCSAIHKIVYFDLAPGLYGLEVSNAPKDSLTVMLFRKP